VLQPNLTISLNTDITRNDFFESFPKAWLTWYFCQKQTSSHNSFESFQVILKVVMIETGVANPVSLQPTHRLIE
jgi:hypothetical protein